MEGEMEGEEMDGGEMEGEMEGEEMEGEEMEGEMEEEMEGETKGR